MREHLGELRLGGTLRNRATQEADAAMSRGILQFTGNGLVSLEAAGINLGPNVSVSANQGNFGIGRLIVGDEQQASRLNLLEWVDNGNRSDEDPEALYLWGRGADDGLTLLHGSTLFVGAQRGTIDVFVRIGGEVVNLQSLFTSPNQTIPFGDGFLSNVTLGDFNADGSATVSDLELLRGAIATGADDPMYDLDASGAVDSQDLQEWLDDVVNTYFGDADLDGNVDLADLNVIRNGFGAAADWSGGDFDGDGSVGLNDLNAVRNHFGASRQAPVGTPVPEPAGLLLGAVTAVFASTQNMIRRVGSRRAMTGMLLVPFCAGSVPAAIYRWDTREVITYNLSPGPGMQASNYNLSYADLRGFNLAGAWFNQASLYEAKLNGSSLVGANFYRAMLSRADLTGADIRGAHFGEVVGEFSAAQLYSTASYVNRDLSGINMNLNFATGWNLDSQNLTDAKFRMTRLNNTSFREALLVRADLFQADLSGADLTGANLEEAMLIETAFDGATLGGAVVRKALFNQTTARGFTAAQLYSTATYQSNDLSAIKFWNETMDGWNFAGKQLSESTWVNVSLVGASFEGADLSGARIELGDLTNADFRNARLVGVRFGKNEAPGSNWENADVAGASVGALTTHGLSAEQFYRTANYRAADLSDVSFAGGDLRGWSFEAITISGTDISSADVRGASFREATSRGFVAQQLYSTDSYRDRDLTGLNLSNNQLTGWNFERKNLADADFSSCDLTGANLSGSTLTGASFGNAIIRDAKFDRIQSATSLSADQLYSTASYQQGDLTGISLKYRDLTSWNFAAQRLDGAALVGSDLANANFAQADLRGADLSGAKWNGAVLNGAELQGANFSEATQRGFVSGQLYSTSNYQRHDLAGTDLSSNDLHDWDLSGQDLTGVNFRQSTLAGTDFSGANIRAAELRYTVALGFTAEQLYSTQSHQSGDLRALDLGNNELMGWNLSHQELAGARFTLSNLTDANFSGSRLNNANFQSATINGADFSFADLRGATMNSTSGAVLENTIMKNGVVNGLFLAGGDLLVVVDDDGNLPMQPSRAPLPILVNDFALISGEGSLRLMFEDDAWDSTIRFAAGITVQLRGEIELLFAPDVNVASQVGRTFKVFDWTGVAPDGTLRLNSPFLWDTSLLFETGEVTLAGVGVLGDTNGDGFVDLVDLNNVRNHFGEAGQGISGDTNGDNVVDLVDVNNVRNHFGVTVSLSNLPEPTTFVMVATMSPLLPWWLARKRR